MRASVSFETKCVAFVEARCANLKERASATGFFWRVDERIFLISNRHVVTGRNETGVMLENAFDPLFLDVHFYSKNGRSTDGYTSVEFKSIRVNLWKNGEPDWIEHQDHRNFDVVAIDLGENLDVFAVNDKEQDDRIWAEAGSDCFIVGFPQALRGPAQTPIWKRASIATEPTLDFNETPVFLCDSATREGMSGAPVFVKALGNFGREGEGPHSGFFGFWTKFIGVYAGRNGNDQTGFQLGRVWRSEVVSQMIENPKRPTAPFSRQEQA
ncbi:trypsin-like peptidase domain-containing protein [Sinisalibacter lacisalsi]|uniref:trypsin-like peptidase domain-containing protein n=1 Tax=Sinisalibacter lacisalsi TaxID=1526570 RepID=UPI00166C6B5E|nr:trypsin-like peptidase domain-containing protein [Sinisalibacter lacisalsi]